MSTHPLWLPYAARANERRQSQRTSERQTLPGPLQAHQEAWQHDYEELRELILRAVPDQVMAINHVGSTAVPELLAKPVIDVDLTVPDAEDEARYIPRLEIMGFRLIFRDELGGDQHRQLTFARPNANLHAWSPGAIEPKRHQLFVAWLRDHALDRERYGEAKIRAAHDSSSVYNDVKAAAVYDIYERAFAADPDHDHEPRPRQAEY